MKVFLITLLVFPALCFASEKYDTDFTKLKNNINCSLDEAYAVAKSRAQIELSGLANKYEENSIDITGWKKKQKSIVFNANFKHDRNIGMYCEDNIEIVISKDCEFLKLHYQSH